MDIVVNLLMSVIANVLGYLACRWIDRYRKGR